MGRPRALSISCVVLLSLLIPIRSGRAAFDLSGPRIDVKVIRGGKELPISEVPSLLPGDRLWLHPDLPEGQSVHYLLIAAFLRGSTNPPPDGWFTRAETWNKRVQEEGIVVTVPQDAQQALVFLAPATGGDFGTLRNAVQGKPGAFVRAAQDLNQASLDRSRIDKYLAVVQQTTESDPQLLHDRSVLLTRSLSLKLNQQCFDKPAAEQIPCLTQTTSDLVLNDGRSQSMVAAITSGPSADLIGAVTGMPMAGGGFYYSYLGVFMDLARLMDNLHTAEYQYIAALALPDEGGLNLKLNTPPSFHKPKSVLVASLPPVEKAQLPTLRPVDPNEVFCLERPPLVLPVVGAPLVYSNDFAHGVTLHVQTKSGRPLDLPAVADAARGGFVVDTHALHGADLSAELDGTLRGMWGFDTFIGPSFMLRNAHEAKWTIPSSEQRALIVGRQDSIHLQSNQACCVDEVTLKDQRGKEIKANWKLMNPGELEVEIPLQESSAGPATLLVKQAGTAEPDALAVRTYAEAAHLDGFTLHAGDLQGELKGTRLDEVSALELSGVRFTPASLRLEGDRDELGLKAPDAAATAALRPGGGDTAHVQLKDGRVLDAPATVEPPRPRLALISLNVTPGADTAAAIHLGNSDELPQDGQLSFVVKTQLPAEFPRSEKIEVSTVDGSSDAMLTVGDGSLTLQDSSTVVAVLDPSKSLGSSAFGPLRFRPLDASGAAGDWQKLATLVRVPGLQELRCPRRPDLACTLTGTNLFLIDSVAADPQFAKSVPVPVGFVGSTLSVPRPSGTEFYLKLRDDPAVVDTATLPILPELNAGAGGRE
ncbi:MAG TPA: hypothetical protein VL523_06200 [Terriglobia bacterium]|nr:hypothetical protein [Terriglobia bacterium]